MRKIAIIGILAVIALIFVFGIRVIGESPKRMIFIGNSTIPPTKLVEILKEKEIDPNRILMQGSVVWSIETDVDYESAVREALKNISQVTLR